MQGEWVSSESAVRRRQGRIVSCFDSSLTLSSPLMSMLTHMFESPSKLPRTIHLLYSSRLPQGGLFQVLFFPRLKRLFQEAGTDRRMTLFLTGADGDLRAKGTGIQQRRLETRDVLNVLSTAEKQATVVYVCGPPSMTDEIVKSAEAEGMKGRVFCEKWW